MSIFPFTRKKNKLPQTKFTLSIHNAWLLWGCQCLNIALITPELSPWMLGIISLSFMWQALFISKKSTAVNNKTPYLQQTVNLQSSGFIQESLIPKRLLRNNTKSDKTKADNAKADKSNLEHHISPVVLGTFAIAGCLAITFSAQGLGVLLSMVHLLSFAYALKAFELKKRSDFYQLFLLGLFLVGSALIFRQNLVFSLIAIAVLIVNLAVLLQFFSHKKPVQKTLKTASLLFAQSMLLAAVLFVVFPRLSPFWQVPQANSATTGLSDTVKPGDIAKLAQSTKLAFRVNFTEGNIPAYSKLYWRAMTLEGYDGRKWSRVIDEGKLLNESPRLLGFNPRELALGTKSAEKLSYQVITEPSFQSWLFALAPAVSLNKSVMMLPDFTMQSRSVITQSKAYQLDSYLNQPLEVNLPERIKALNLSFPKKSNPRLVALAEQFKEQYPNSEQRAEEVLNQIRQQQFFYTLEPPLLTNNSLDQFYFDTKAGFCEHYASAFTFIMRASGVPSRVVTGYLGGEYNGMSQANLQSSSATSITENVRGRDGHMSVYQSDAHAWSEIWVAGKGWLRVDPTGAVDPERVASGWSNSLQQQQSELNNALFSLYQLKQFALLNELRLKFDALDYQWTRWVLGYSSSKQYDLLQQLLGQVKPWKIALIIAGSIGLSALLLVLFFFLKNYKKSKSVPKVPWLDVYQQSLVILASKGLIKSPSTTAQNYFFEIKEKCPDISLVFARVHTSFTRLSYQELTVEEQKREFKKLKKHYKALIQEVKKI